jgi:hypothetical protein
MFKFSVNDGDVFDGGVGSCDWFHDEAVHYSAESQVCPTAHV